MEAATGISPNAPWPSFGSRQFNVRFGPKGDKPKPKRKSRLAFVLWIAPFEV
jgi:hypothetical protein